MTTLLDGQTVSGIRSTANRRTRAGTFDDRDAVVDPLRGEHVEGDGDVRGFDPDWHDRSAGTPGAGRRRTPARTCAGPPRARSNPRRCR